MSKRKTCKATTSRGTRCSRIAVDKGCCRQHYTSVYGSKSKVASPRRFTIGKVLSVYKGCPPGTMRRKGYTRSKGFTRRKGFTRSIRGWVVVFLLAPFGPYR